MRARAHRTGERRQRHAGQGPAARRWSADIATVSTFPPEGLFTADAETTAATMARPDASLNRRQSVRVIGSSVALAQIGIVGFDGQIELEALRLYGLPEAAAAVLAGPTHGWGRREIPFSAAYDPPSLGAGASHQTNMGTSGNRLAVLGVA